MSNENSGANFTPNMGEYTPQGAFRFWVQNALPLVYDDSLSYYELLNKVVYQLNVVISNMDTAEANINNLLAAYNQLQEYVNHYFDSLDVQEEIDNKIDRMVADGELQSIIGDAVSELIGDTVASQIDAVVAEQIDDTVADQLGSVVEEQIGTPASEAATEWLQENVTPVGSAVVVDESLSISGAAADAKVTGDTFDGIEDVIRELNVMDYIMKYRIDADNSSRNGIDFEWTKGKCRVHGTSTANNAFGTIVNASLAELGMSVGVTYKVKYASTNVRFQVFSLDASDNPTSLISVIADSEFTVPSNCRKLLFRFNVPSSGTTVDETVCAYVYDAFSIQDINDVLDNCYKSWTPTLDENNKFSLDDMPLNSVAFIQAAWILDEQTTDLNVNSISTGYLEKIGRGTFSMFRFTVNATSIIYLGFKIAGVYRWRGTGSIYYDTIALFGDSIMWGRIGGATGVVRTETGIPYYVASESGQPVHDFSVGSMGWLSKQYLNYNMEEYIRTVDITSYNVIAIMLGANDGMAALGTYTDTTQNTIMGAVYRTLSYIYTQNHNCLVILINSPIGKGSEFPYYNPDSPHYTGWTWTQFYQQMRLFGNKYAVPVIESWEALNAWNRQYLIGDNIHPTEEGYHRVGKYIAGQIKSLI